MRLFGKLLIAGAIILAGIDGLQTRTVSTDVAKRPMHDGTGIPTPAPPPPPPASR